MRNKSLTEQLLKEQKALTALQERAKARITDIVNRQVIGAGQSALEDRKASALVLELNALNQYIAARKVCDDLGV